MQYYTLPQEIRDRMPSAYTRALKLPLGNVAVGEEMYSTVLDLAVSFHLNYSMEFPAINQIAHLIQYCKHLALPGTFSSSQFRMFAKLTKLKWNRLLRQRSYLPC